MTNEVHPGVVNRIAFGSCNKHDVTNLLFDDISSYDPDIFLWLGDIVYADTFTGTFKFENTPLEKVAEKFEILKKNQDYANLISKARHTLGIWDDHDYNMNDGGKNNPTKEGVKFILLDFLDEALNSHRWKQNGIYRSYIFGDKGKRIKIILLDNRYFATDIPRLDRLLGRIPPEADILGDEQWAWLENEFKTGEITEYTIIANGIQLVADDKGPLGECWGHYGKSRERIFNLIADYNIQGAFFLSGDIHCSEMLVTSCGRNGYPLYEITSSGMTHSWGNNFPLRLPFGLSKTVPFGYSTFMWLAFRYMKPPRYQIEPTPIFTVDKSYATLTFNWEEDFYFTVDFRGNNNITFDSYTIYRKDLLFNKDYQIKGDHCRKGHGWFDNYLHLKYAVVILISLCFIYFLIYFVYKLIVRTVKSICWRKDKVQ